jgi:hypothetical protein
MLDDFAFPKIIKMIRSNHPYAYKSGQWGAITGLVTVKGRSCYNVIFQDGSVDHWPVVDEQAEYEFAPPP